MQDLPKPVKRMLREQASRAHAEELRRALLPLADAFDRWRAGELDSFALSDLIHEFHDGEAREIWKRYNYVQPYVSVSYAIHAGILEREEMPPQLIEALARSLAYYEEEDRVKAESGSELPVEEL